LAKAQKFMQFTNCAHTATRTHTHMRTFPVKIIMLRIEGGGGEGGGYEAGR